jgi:hypothetical protein
MSDWWLFKSMLYWPNWAIHTFQIGMIFLLLAPFLLAGFWLQGALDADTDVQEGK